MVSVEGPPTVAPVDAERDEQPPPAIWEMLGRLEKAAIGLRRSDGSITVRRREPAGCALYGPYWQLPAGFYRLNFCCRADAPDNSSHPVLGVEVIVLNRVQQAWRDFTAMELQAGSASVNFEVPAELGLGSGNDGRFEFKFFHFGRAGLRISAVDLVRLPDNQTASDSPRQWRMLGRLQKSWLGRRRRDGAVTTREREPAGCLLYGGWPYLRLPRGCYRVSVQGAAGTPRVSSQPVLGLEIIGRHRWRGQGALLSRHNPPGAGGTRLAWRDFTASELNDGLGSVEFDVPAEMGIESGDDAPFEFRLFHLGNANLCLRAVDLSQVGEEQRAARSPSEWRVPGRLRHSPIAVGRTGRQTYGGRPFLQLSAGRYRLSFCCRADPTLTAVKPILQVQVVARTKSASRWGLKTRPVIQAEHEFTAEELQAGAGSIDFDVLPAFGRETSGARFELLFFDRGNTGLAISDVTIGEEAGFAPTGSAAPTRAAGLPASRRKKIVMIGNCQSDILCQALNRTESLNGAFEAKYHFVMLPNQLFETVKRDLETCDILMVQDIWDWQNFPLREYIRDDLEVIRYPAVRFASLWPFDGWNGPADKEAHEREAPNLTFPYLDGLLGRLRKVIPDKEQRFQAYCLLEAEGVINYRRLHELEKRRLIALDNKFDTDIGAFVLDNFHKRRLFRTTVRPDREVLNRLMTYLLKRIGVGGTHSLPNRLNALPDSPEIPVHPKVAKDLGVKWADENTKYLYGGERITWETYVRRYIEHYG